MGTSPQKKRGPGLLLILAMSLWGCASEPEEGRLEVVYAQDFSSSESLESFSFSDPEAWRRAEVDGNGCMELHANSAYAPTHRSPRSIAARR